MTHPTLIPEDNLLTERIQAATKYECIKRGSVPSLQRANRYLLAAQEAIRRYAVRIEEYEQYNWRESFATKEYILKQAIRNRNTYENCWAYYKEILLKELGK